MPVSWNDLGLALATVDADPDQSVWVHRETGAFRYSADEPDDAEPPAPEAGWISIPDSRDLGLGKRQLEDFVVLHQSDLDEQLQRCFERKGGWRRFKDLLDRRGLLHEWHRFEQAESDRALMAWAAEQGLVITGRS